MRCPVFPFPRPIGRTLAAAVSLLRLRAAVDPAGRRGRNRGADAHRLRSVHCSPRTSSCSARGERMVGNTSYCTKPEAAKAVAKVGSVMSEHRADHRPAARPAGHQPEPAAAGGPVGAARPARAHLHQPESFAEMCDQFLELAPCSVGRTARPGDRRRGPPGRGGAHCHRGPAPGARSFSRWAPIPFFPRCRTRSRTSTWCSAAVKTSPATAAWAMTTEQVLALDPEVIIIAVMGSRTASAGGEKAGGGAGRAIARCVTAVCTCSTRTACAAPRRSPSRPRSRPLPASSTPA